MTASVIVATEQESTVRIYVGHAHNGGMEQAGQFVCHRPIDPHDLADMAVSLATQFGWVDAPELEPEPAAPPALPPVKPVAHATRPKKYKLKADQRIKCAVCDYTGPRKYLRSHLKTVHGWSKERAALHARTAPELGTGEPVAPHALEQYLDQPAVVKPERIKLPSKARSNEMVRCPEVECGHMCMRKNLTTHLLSKQHAYTRERALEAARIAERTVVRHHKPKNGLRHGTAGARELEERFYPKVLEWLATQTEPVTAAMLVPVFNGEKLTQSTARTWLERLVKRGDVRKTPSHKPHQANLYALATPLDSGLV